MLCQTRKQRKRNGVKRVYKEVSSRSDSEDGSSDEDGHVRSAEQKNDKVLLQLRWRENRKGKAQSNKQNQKVPRRTLIKNKNASSTNKKKDKSKWRLSEVVEENPIGPEKDLDIDVDAFVNHVPIIRDVDREVLSSCPFCFVMYDDITRHIKDCHKAGETICKPGAFCTLFAFLALCTVVVSHFHMDKKLAKCLLILYTCEGVVCLYIYLSL